jgi:hypothetical protein
MRRIVTFSGGLGAQILSCSAYFFLQQLDGICFSDISYFDSLPRVAQPGEGYSIWKWELSKFGIPLSIFSNHSQEDQEEIEVLSDGNPKKLDLAYSGLQVPSIKNLFLLPDSVKTQCREMVGSQKYACIHMRRGDYLNVASYLVPDEDFLSIIQKFSQIIPHIVIVTDSPLNSEFQNSLRNIIDSKITLIIGGDPFISHAIMRMSSALVCSNSQYSYTAACLMELESLTIFPKRFSEGSDAEHIHNFFADQSNFQIIGGKPKNFISNKVIF